MVDRVVIMYSRQRLNFVCWGKRFRAAAISLKQITSATNSLSWITCTHNIQLEGRHMFFRRKPLDAQVSNRVSFEKTHATNSWLNYINSKLESLIFSKRKKNKQKELSREKNERVYIMKSKKKLSNPFYLRSLQLLYPIGIISFLSPTTIVELVTQL